MVEIFPVLCEATAPIEPRNCALDDPAFGKSNKTLGLIATPHDFGYQVPHRERQAIMEYRPCIGRVGKQPLEKGKQSEQGRQNQHPTVPILHVGRRDQRVQQQAQGIDENVPLLALDQFACIEPMWIDAGPPFSALFTLWLSMIQAVGLASRSASSRHLT